MNSFGIKVIRIGGILGCLAFAAWTVSSMLHPVLSLLISKRWSYMAVFDLAFGAAAIGVAGAFAWLAWRLCRWWDAATVRWFIGIWMAMLLLWADMLPMRWESAATSRITDTISSVLAVPLLVLGALAYRYLSHRLIRLAGLRSVLDIYGQPMGHQVRIRNFAGVLGWAIFLAGGAFNEVFAFSKNPASWQAGVATLGPIVAGYLTYKMIIWYTKPCTRPSLPAGGFEVITNASPVAHGREST